jgi:hypothetical protein
MRKLFMALAILGLAAACGENKLPEKTVFDAQVQTIKKAREVEGKVQEAAEKQREAMERSEGKGAEAGESTPYQK